MDVKNTNTKINQSVPKVRLETTIITCFEFTLKMVSFKRYQYGPYTRPKAFDAPSKYIFQQSSSGDFSSSICSTAIKSSFGKSKLMGSYSSLALSARKLAIALPLMAI